MEQDELKFAIEAILFASGRPLTAEELKVAFEEKLEAADIETRLEQLKADYESQNRGFRLTRLAGGWQIVSDERFSAYLKRFYQDREKKRISPASLETLSVVAYRQPVTKADIEFIRGVNVDGALKTLLERGLVKMAGRKEVPGRPILYGTTSSFLDHFGLHSLKDLPPLKEYTLKDIPENLLPPEMRTSQPVEPVASAEAGEEATPVNQTQEEGTQE